MGPAQRRDGTVYPVDVAVEAADRQGLLRDISEVFAREKMNVIGVQTQSVKDNRGGTAWMTFTVEVADVGPAQPGAGAWWPRCKACVRRADAELSAVYSVRAQKAAFACYNDELRTVLRRVAQLVRAPP